MCKDSIEKLNNIYEKTAKLVMIISAQDIVLFPEQKLYLFNRKG